MTTDALPHCHLQVKDEWLDYNGHMNMGFYLVAFDHYGTDTVLAKLGIDKNYIEQQQRSTFCIGANIDYVREAFRGDRLTICSQLLDWNDKCLHFFHRMTRSDDDSLIAYNECLFLHVDLNTRKSTPMPEQIRTEVAAMFRAHQTLGTPAGVSRQLEIRHN